MPLHTPTSLQASVDLALDHDCQLEEWETLQDHHPDSMGHELLHHAATLPLVGPFVQRHLFNKIMHWYDVVSSFLVARGGGRQAPACAAGAPA